MRLARIITALTMGAPLFLPMISAAQEHKIDRGKQEYDTHCAVCHGLKGKGDGLYAGFGSQFVANLTTLTKRNKGVFPFARVYESIDGTELVKAHGPRDMPIWGSDYRGRAGEYYLDVPYDPDVYARARILALTEYVYRLQEK